MAHYAHRLAFQNQTAPVPTESNRKITAAFVLPTPDTTQLEKSVTPLSILVATISS